MKQRFDDEHSVLDALLVYGVGLAFLVAYRVYVFFSRMFHRSEKDPDHSTWCRSGTRSACESPSRADPEAVSRTKC